MVDDEMIKFRVKKIIEHCNQIESDIGLLSFEEFKKSSLLCRATAFTLGNISEQITKLKEKLSDKYPKIEWKKIANFRVLESHIYWKMDYRLIYDIATIDLPILKKQVIEILNELNQVDN